MQANGVPLTLLQQPVLAVRGCLEGRESFPMWTRVCRQPNVLQLPGGERHEGYKMLFVGRS